MEIDNYEGPTPGDPSILSAEHDDLVNGLYELRGRFTAITADERVILEAAIMTLEYLSEYAEGTPAEDGLGLAPAEITARVAKLEYIRSQYPIHWRTSEFMRFIASGGFELHNGRLVPRL